MILIANILGSISGLGGGSIIKPVFDFLGFHSLAEISFYSSVAVFVMAITSTIKQVRMKTKFNSKIAIGMVVGSVAGGYLGNFIFNQFMQIYNNEAVVNLIQIVLVLITLVISYYLSVKPYSMKLEPSIPLSLFVSLFLGVIASFLGIGGGPLNIALILLVYDIKIKEATVYSILTIVFSQASKLFTQLLSSQVATFDLSPIIFIIVSALVAGYIGAQLNSKMSNNNVQKVYKACILIITGMNLYNGVQIVLRMI